jgi:RNA 2',3'-cyclic 3'-phosphodiesterase
MRLFFALWPPPETAQALAQWAGALQGKPTAAEKIHLTLAFLGDANPAAAEAAARVARAAAFELPIEAAGYWKHNKIVWVGPTETPSVLMNLANFLKAESRPFAAHVTLLRKAPPPASLPPLPAVRWPVREFALVKSDYARYETLVRFPLH